MIARLSLTQVDGPCTDQSHWPPELAKEAGLLLGSFVPRGRVMLFVPDRDRVGRAIEVGALLDDLKGRISEATAGSFALGGGEGRYSPPGGLSIRENTTVILVYLPVAYEADLPRRLLDIFIAFGCSAEQAAVQVEVGGRGFWLPTGLLLEQASRRREQVEGVALRLG